MKCLNKCVIIEIPLIFHIEYFKCGKVLSCEVVIPILQMIKLRLGALRDLLLFNS